MWEQKLYKVKLTCLVQMKKNNREVQMFNYKNILIVAFEKNKSNTALNEIKKILTENKLDHKVYDESKPLENYVGFDLVLVIGGDGSMLSAAKLFSGYGIPFLSLIHI